MWAVVPGAAAVWVNGDEDRALLESTLGVRIVDDGEGAGFASCFAGRELRGGVGETLLVVEL